MKIIKGLKHKHEELRELLDLTKKASIQFDKLIKNGNLRNKISVFSKTSPGIASPLAVHLEHEKVNVTIVYIPEVSADETNKELVEKSITKGNTAIPIENVTRKFLIDDENQADSYVVNNLTNELNPLAITNSIHITKREHQVIDLIGDGSTNQEIADQLNLSLYTIKSHVSNILGKLSLNSRLQIAKYAHLSKYYKIAM